MSPFVYLSGDNVKYAFGACSSHAASLLHQVCHGKALQHKLTTLKTQLESGVSHDLLN